MEKSSPKKKAIKLRNPYKEHIQANKPKLHAANTMKKKQKKDRSFSFKPGPPTLTQK